MLYICYNVTHPATTACCSCLGAVHAHGGAEGDGGRGAGVPAWHAVPGAASGGAWAKSGGAMGV